MRPQIGKILILALYLFTAATTLGQSVNNGSGPPPPSNQRGPNLPIDDNLIILIIAGLLYGTYVLHKKARIKNTPL